MPAQTFQMWTQGLKPERKRPEKIKVERNFDDTDDLLVYKPIFGGKRAVQVGTMKRRNAFGRPVAPLFSNKMEEEGVALLVQDVAPRGYSHEYPCQMCQGFIFPSQPAWKGYMGEALERLVLHPLDPKKFKWKKLCRHCAKFARLWYRPAQSARGELRVRIQMSELSEARLTEETNAFIQTWAKAYNELRKELKKDGASATALKKMRGQVAALLTKENLQ